MSAAFSIEEELGVDPTPETPVMRLRCDGMNL